MSFAENWILLFIELAIFKQSITHFRSRSALAVVDRTHILFSIIGLWFSAFVLSIFQMFDSPECKCRSQGFYEPNGCRLEVNWTGGENAAINNQLIELQLRKTASFCLSRFMRCDARLHCCLPSRHGIFQSNETTIYADDAFPWWTWFAKSERGKTFTSLPARHCGNAKRLNWSRSVKNHGTFHNKMGVFQSRCDDTRMRLAAQRRSHSIETQFYWMMWNDKIKHLSVSVWLDVWVHVPLAPAGMSADISFGLVSLSAAKSIKEEIILPSIKYKFVHQHFDVAVTCLTPFLWLWRITKCDSFHSSSRLRRKRIITDWENVSLFRDYGSAGGRRQRD